MARYAIIENGIVTNMAESTSALVAWNARALTGWKRVTSGDVQIGDTFDGTNYARPEAPVVVPQSVTPAQGKLALLGAGLLDEAEAAINALTGDTKTAALIYWNNALAFERDNPLIVQIGGALGLTSSQIDDLFIAAAIL